ncbi:MAG: DUF748 domain-containing protein [Burkholderiaceae bacterium]|nr:DUF748 domain-containing protein [Burkholderiaceae bacterium]
MSGPAAPAAQTGDAAGRRRRWLRVLLAVLAVVGVYALLGFVVAPRVAQGQLVERLAAELGRPVAIGRIEFNPFTLVLRVHDFSVSEPAGGGDGEFAGFARLEADASWRSLYRLAPVLSSASLHQPRLHLARDAAGRYSIQDLVDKWAARPPAEPGPTPRFSVANIVVDDGRFEFDDGKLGVRQEISSLALHLPFVSSLPVDEKIWVEPKLAASINGAPFELTGKSLPFSPTRDSTIDIDLEGVDLTRFVGYPPLPLPVQLQAGRLDTALKIAFSQPAGSAPTVAVTGSAKLASLDLRQPDGSPLMAAESIAADAIALTWPENRHAIGRVTITEPNVAIRRKAGERRFLERVLEAAAKSAARPQPQQPEQQPQPQPPAAGKEPANTGTSGAQWRVDEIVVNGGRLAFEDAQFEPKPLRLDASALEATLRKLSSDPAVPAEFDLAAGPANGEHVSASGSARWQEGAVDAKLQVSDLALKQWWWIAEQRLAVDALDGALSVGARLHAAQGSGGTTIRFDEGTARLRNLSLRQRWDKRTLLALPELDVDGVSVDPGKREVSIGALTTRGGSLLVRRDKDARLNLQRLMIVDRDAGGPAQAKPEPADAARGAGAAAPDWTLMLDKLAIGGFGVDVEDQRGGKAANLRVQAIDVGASGLSSADRAPPAKVQMRARVDRRGTLSLSGEIGAKPLAGTLQVAARDLAIVPLQPYFTEYVNALVSSGSVSADGSLRLAVHERAAPRVGWKGRVSVAGFSAASKEANDDLLRWKSLAFDQVDFDSEPLKVDVGGITLEDFHARVILNAEGRLNLRELLVDRRAQSADGKAQSPSGASGAATGTAAAPASAPAPAASSAPAAAGSAPPAPQRNLRVGGVRLVNGNIDFSDFFVKPNYSANLTGMNGQISQITPGQAGDLELRGRIDHTGSVEILGKVNPLADPLYLDLKASASDIDLPRLSPYSGKYVGYGIEKGKLSAKVAYKVENRQLSAENNIVLDQLTFGDKVDSPDALSSCRCCSRCRC